MIIHLYYFGRVFANYEHFVPGVIEGNEIISEASKVKDDFPTELNSVSLGRIISELWGQKVTKTKRGPSNDRRGCYLNLRRRVISQAAQETFEEFMKSEMKFGGRWSKISDHSNSISIIRYESWSLDNRRVTTEIRLTQLSQSELRYTLISHGCEIDLANVIDIKTIERHKLSDRIKLIVSLIDNSHLCRGASLAEDEPSMNNVVGKYVDFTNGYKEETKVFSRNCFIINRPEGKCCYQCSKIKNYCSRAKKRRLSRDEVHPKTNKRYMSKEEIAQQLRREKRQKKNLDENSETEQSKSKTDLLE